MHIKEFINFSSLMLIFWNFLKADIVKSLISIMLE